MLVKHTPWKWAQSPSDAIQAQGVPEAGVTTLSGHSTTSETEGSNWAAAWPLECTDDRFPGSQKARACPENPNSVYDAVLGAAALISARPAAPHPAFPSAPEQAFPSARRRRYFPAGLAPVLAAGTLPAALAGLPGSRAGCAAAARCTELALSCAAPGLQGVGRRGRDAWGQSPGRLGPRGGLSFCAERSPAHGLTGRLCLSAESRPCDFPGAGGGKKLGHGFGLCTTFSFTFGRRPR